MRGMSNLLAAACRLAILLVVILVEIAIAFPFTPTVSGTIAPSVPRSTPVIRTAPPHVEPAVVVQPVERWPGLAVVDFRRVCNYVYVLRLARPLDREINPDLLLASIREGIVPEDLDAELDFAGYLGPFASPTAILSQMTENELRDFHSVFPGGHFDYFNHRGEGSVLSGMFAPSGPRVLWHRAYVVESQSASVTATGGAWFPLEARFVLSQTDCD